VRHERRGVAIPMAILSLLSSWLLLAGALGALRRQPGAIALWRWACLVNIPLTILSMLVTVVQARELMDRLGPPLAEALAKVSKRGAAAEMAELWAFCRLYVTGWAVFYGAWVLWLAVTVLGLRRYAPLDREA
jgi:hypothetical protein